MSDTVTKPAPGEVAEGGCCSGLGGEMNFRLLGPLMVGDDVLVRGARERKLLALLLLEAPAPVSRAEAARWVLGKECGSDESGLHVAVSRLRRQLREHNIDAKIERTLGGLRLVTDFDTIDCVQFKRLLLEARTLTAQGSDHCEALREALALWRGEVLAGEDLPPHAAITQLNELRLAAVEEVYAAGTATGDDPSRLAELLAWCRSHPQRERLWALAMVDLYRNGRQVEALALFQEARNRLVDLLGLEPGPDLVALERRILCHDPTLFGGPFRPGMMPAPEESIPPPVLGNLPVPSTSFVGRESEVKDVVGLVRTHRLVTLTGVGGVGKTRLAVQVAAELVGEFPDGVWLVELAAVGDPEVVPDVAATALGVTARAGLQVTDSLVRSLSGRRLLIILDNCEHVLDAAADLVEALVARTSTVHMLATSREGLRVGAEQLWAVPPLGLQGGATSAAVELFVDRARAVAAGFELRDPADAEAVEDICRRLDGIPLAIELAAARMVSISPQDVCDRLGDRFRLLAGSRRGAERHRTLGHAVGWSYDLLDETERMLLQRCSVFADGFDLEAAARTGDGVDEYAVLDGLDSLVRKSLVTVDRVGGRARYGMLETIRQFAEDQLAASCTVAQVRDRHAAYFAEQAVAYWNVWDGPDQRMALDWVAVELANLRAGFRWATDQGDLATAGVIAAHTAMMGMPLERFEAVGWVEEILPAASAAQLRQLPRLYTAASLCTFTGRPDAGARYAETAQALEAEGGHEPFADGFSAAWEAMAQVHAGRSERAIEIYTELSAKPGARRVYGLGGQTMVLAMVGKTDECAPLAEEAVRTGRDLGNPFFLAKALYGLGLALARKEPARARETFQQALAYAREHRQVLVEASIYRDAARVETVSGDISAALDLYDFAIDVQFRSGNLANLAVTFASLSVCFDRLERPEIAATLYGITTHISAREPGIRRGVFGHLREVLGGATFERCVADGAAMEPASAVAYARQRIRHARHELQPPAKN